MGGANILQNRRQLFIDRTAKVFVLYQLPHLQGAHFHIGFRIVLLTDQLEERLTKEDYDLVEALQNQASIAQSEENECHFKVGFSAGLLVQQEAVEQVKNINDE